MRNKVLHTDHLLAALIMLVSTAIFPSLNVRFATRATNLWNQSKANLWSRDHQELRNNGTAAKTPDVSHHNVAVPANLWWHDQGIWCELEGVVGPPGLEPGTKGL